MATGESAFDGPIESATIEATEISDEGVMLASVEVNEDDASPREAVYGSLGDGGRPLAPDDDGAAEAICARASDRLPVIAARDLRIEKARATTPAVGTVYKAGYYGAELRFDVVDGEERSTATLTDANGSELVLDEDGVRAPTSPLVQGDPGTAADVLLAQPAIDLLAQIGPITLLLAAAVNALAPGTITPQQITDLTTALAPFLVPGSPNAPTTRAPDLRGEPGA
jgi:hypothetical protein